jgi:2,4-dienoyl-CoA reductase-like NADH-dependent reductase (Old Yellow Enzyme family)
MLEALYQPITLAEITIKNRFAMAPMTRGRSPGGIPGPDVAEYYRRRAAGGAGLIITEGALIGHPLAAAAGSAAPRLTARTVAAWHNVTRAVHEAGSHIFAQLWHQGPQISPGIAAFAIEEKQVRAATEPEREEVAVAFIESAIAAKNAGFDGIELHGAHGYFLDSYLRVYGLDRTQQSNHRYVVNLVAQIRRAVGSAFPIGLRFSQWSVNEYRLRYMLTPADMERVLLPLRDAGVNIFHASVGFRSFWLQEFEQASLSLAGWTRKITGCPVITVGGIGLQKEQFFNQGEGCAKRLERMFAEGEFDLAAIGRALIADPQWCEKVCRGEVESIVQFEEKMLEQYP